MLYQICALDLEKLLCPSSLEVCHNINPLWYSCKYKSGLFCYCLFAIFYSIFDFDQIGHKGAGTKLKRFGRLFSAGFYGFIGVAGIQILLNVRQGSSLSSAVCRLYLRNNVNGMCS